MAKIFVQIVNSAVIHQPPVGVENRSFRSDLHLALLHQNVLRITQRGERVAELTIMLANRIGAFPRARINQEECGIVAMLRAELLNRGSVAV
jgi:hypothetical protein